MRRLVGVCVSRAAAWGLAAFALSAAANRLGDFNGDGKADVLLRHADGRWYLYPMDGPKPIAGRGTTNQPADWSWRLVGLGDFDADGRSDALLRYFDGSWRLSPMAGRREIARGAGRVALPAGDGWRMAGVGDFDGDGTVAEVLLRHADGAWRYYALRGRAIVDEASPGLTRNPRWQLKGVGDLNGDGRDDVLLRDDSGSWYYYAMAGGRRQDGSGLVRGLPRDTAWRFAALGRFGADAESALLLRRADGRWRYYPMQGRIAAKARTPRVTPNPIWQLAGVGDLDGDGRDDVLLRRTDDGRWYFYAMMDHQSGDKGTARLFASRNWSVAKPQGRVPPPPLPRDRHDLALKSDEWRTAEFAANPGSHEMNAHWAYARGVTGAGEAIGMVDTGLYALHEEFDRRLHDETIYTVIDDDAADPNRPAYSYFKAGDRAPGDAYPAAPQADRSDHCRTTRRCKYLDYGHGTKMASTATGSRNGRHAHGMAFDAKLLFRPSYQRGANIGASWYHGPHGRTVSGITRHDRVRNVGDLAPVVSNAWLTGTYRFHIYPPQEEADGYFPFYRALGPRYSGFQSALDGRRRAVFVWSAGNRPITGGPLTDGAVLPSITERQLRAATGGEAGLADVLLTAEQRRGLTPSQARERAEQAVEAWRRQWLAVVAVADREDVRYDYGGPYWRFIDCAARVPVEAARTAAECGIAYTMRDSARCGFASDWCVAVGSTYGAVSVLGDRTPDPTSATSLESYQTSPAAATAGGALGLLFQAYRNADGALTVTTATVVERLKQTANAGIFDHPQVLDGDGRGIVDHEQEQVRALIEIAGASNADLTALIEAARSDFAGLLDGFPLMQEADAGAANFSAAQRARIEAAKAQLTEDQWTRYHVLGRVVDYYPLRWRSIDTFPPLLHRIQKLLDDATTGEQAERARRDLLAQLIRQVEWIDTQLYRLRRNKATVTLGEVRRITVTSIIGHGLIDLKAATDPMR